ncbi:MAG: hypothetical protein HQK53_20420 [Oligoflexia bacterium]|nr:hypothetical protein [Oligoflexia bacterium]
MENIPRERSLEEIIVNGCVLWMERDSRQLCLFGHDGSEQRISLDFGNIGIHGTHYLEHK